MKTPDDQLLARWLDNALSPQDLVRFEAMMAADPALREEAQSMKKMSDAIRANVTFERAVPHADFFNSQIQERIAAHQHADARAKVTPAGGASWLDWLRMPWALAGAAAVLALGFFLTQRDGPHTEILSLYAPSSAVKADVSYSNDAGATVLMLDGLEAFPADRNIAGLTVHRSATDPEMATTTLFDERGGVLLVMAKDASGKPATFGRGL